ncbi:histidine phosphatase family protein [Kribbella deserti]|uniref:Histidine phosphatase family protein n=1 Tax=Kribbella deserti TaxID=1926257 RepID=A0ABV6QUP1_9ACTN
MTATRYLYLVRHGEALPDGSGLTERGQIQAIQLSRRLRDIPFSAVQHGPLARAAQTAGLIWDQLVKDVQLEVSEAAGDYVPYLPERRELPADSADVLLSFLQQATADELERGSVLGSLALDCFTGPADGDEERHELVVTHNFLIGWLVGHAMDAPKWRWLSLNHCNAALTVLKYEPGRPSSVLVYNDMRHLTGELTWTGFPVRPGI